ncbi:hypothetical protein [Thermincola potens]|uniref:hypothetical protein n=1 Tax=Thermincola potens TaxID=863643 RepID=UPI003D7DDE2A
MFTAAHELYHLLFNRDKLENGYSHLIKQDDLGGKQEERAAKTSLLPFCLSPELC